jgi:hypothetical protein
MKFHFLQTSIAKDIRKAMLREAPTLAPIAVVLASGHELGVRVTPEAVVVIIAFCCDGPTAC